MSNGVAPCRKPLRSCSTSHTELSSGLAIPVLGGYQEVEHKNSNEYWNMSVHGSATRNSQKVETNPNVRQRMNGQTKCGRSIEWNLIQP